MMGQHGFISWDDDEKICYTHTLDFIEKAADLHRGEVRRQGRRRDGLRRTEIRRRLTRQTRKDTFAAILPWLRGQVSPAEALHRHRAGRREDPALRQLEGRRRVSPSSARAAPIISCAPRSSRSTSTGIRRPRTPPRSRTSSPPGSKHYRKDYAAYYAHCKHANSPAHARPEPDRRPHPRPRHDRLGQGQVRVAASPPNSTTAPSRSCAAPRRSTNTSRCRSRKPSTSNTGCWRKRSSSACPPRRNSPARSSSSSAPAPASARKPPTASSRKARTSCAST